MNDEAAFLKALRDNPGDDTVRLVYADWLDERSDPRAEYIRLRQQYAQLTARINELAAQCDPVWLAAVGGPRLWQYSLTHQTGRSLWLRSFTQWDIYEGILEGLPTREGNQRTIAGTIEEHRRWGGEPYLIQPEEKLIESFSASLYRGRTPAAIPGIACVGRFTSDRLARETPHSESQLVIIWFQEEFAFPIDPAVREQIRIIDWDTHAMAFDS